MTRVKNLIADWNTFERIWVVLFTAVNIYLYLAWHDTVTNLVISLTGMMSVVLVAKGKTSNYYFGVINVVLYAFVSYENKFYGEAALNALYFLPLQFVGLMMWRRHKARKAADVKVAVLTNKEKAFWVGIIAVATVIFGIILQMNNGAQPYVDSATMILQIVAMYFMVKRYVEQWVLWIITDILLVIMWFITLVKGGNDYTILVMWCSYLANAVWGMINWIKIHKAQAVVV